MPLQRALSLLLPALLVSAAAFTWSVGRSGSSHAWMAAAAFTMLLVVVALRTNMPLWQLPPTRIGSEALPIAGLRNAILLAIVYAWGALALIGAYRLTGLKWQHGLQYAAGMALLGLVHVLVARAMASRHGRLRSPSGLRTAALLTELQCAAAVAGLVFLIGSGKLSSVKPDWAANVIFLTGGVTVVALTVLAVLTHRRLSAPPGAISGS